MRKKKRANSDELVDRFQTSSPTSKMNRPNNAGGPRPGGGARRVEEANTAEIEARESKRERERESSLGSSVFGSRILNGTYRARAPGPPHRQIMQQPPQQVSGETAGEADGGAGEKEAGRKKQGEERDGGEESRFPLNAVACRKETAVLNERGGGRRRGADDDAELSAK